MPRPKGSKNKNSKIIEARPCLTCGIIFTPKFERTAQFCSRICYLKNVQKPEKTVKSQKPSPKPKFEEIQRPILNINLDFLEIPCANCLFEDKTKESEHKCSPEHCEKLTEYLMKEAKLC